MALAATAGSARALAVLLCRVRARLPKASRRTKDLAKDP